MVGIRVSNNYVIHSLLLISVCVLQVDACVQARDHQEAESFETFSAGS